VKSILSEINRLNGKINFLNTLTDGLYILIFQEKMKKFAIFYGKTIIIFWKILSLSLSLDHTILQQFV